jgi:hypothetical protein
MEIATGGRRKPVFKIKTGKSFRTTQGVFRKAQVIKDPKDLPPFYIRGVKAGSKEEYWVSIALDKIQAQEGYRWEYQVPIYGGRQIAGGLVIDFVVYTPGRRTWVSPMGRYFHTGRNEDRMQEINAALKQGVNLIAFFTDELTDKESTYPFIRRKLGL